LQYATNDIRSKAKRPFRKHIAFSNVIFSSRSVCVSYFTQMRTNPKLIDGRATAKGFKELAHVRVTVSGRACSVNATMAFGANRQPGRTNPDSHGFLKRENRADVVVLRDSNVRGRNCWSGGRRWRARRRWTNRAKTTRGRNPRAGGEGRGRSRDSCRRTLKNVPSPEKAGSRARKRRARTRLLPLPSCSSALPCGGSLSPFIFLRS